MITALALASELAGCPAKESTLASRIFDALGRRRTWVRPLAERLIQQFPDFGTLPARELADALEQDEGFQKAHLSGEVQLARWKFHLDASSPRILKRKGNLPAWNVPKLNSIGALAAWLDFSWTETEWLAGRSRPKCLQPVDVQHYVSRWFQKRSVGQRLVESPKSKLKRVQRRILEGILNKISVHDSAHGFCSGRDVKSFVAPHVGQQLAIRMDLRDFFPSVGRNRVCGIFERAGYPETVARLLASLCTTRTPDSLFDHRQLRVNDVELQRLRSLFSVHHLPQGAPTSPSLANLCAFRLDCRLSGIAESFGGTYTRYADDLLFSGDGQFAKSAGGNRRSAGLDSKFLAVVGAIVLEEGFELNIRKTRMMHADQRQLAAGIVFNESPNVQRANYERLKAILHNCARGDPASQNRDSVENFRDHLLGRIGWVRQTNPRRAEKLMAAFERIDWKKSQGV